MSGEEALKAAFDRAFELPPGTDHEALAYRGHERWDSLGLVLSLWRRWR